MNNTTEPIATPRTKALHKTALAAVGLLHGHNSRLFEQLMDRISQARRRWWVGRKPEALFASECTESGDLAIKELRRMWQGSPGVPVKVTEVCRQWESIVNQ